MGGTLIRYTDAGVECHSLSLTRGERGQNGYPDAPVVGPADLGPARARELAEAGRIMGLASTDCFAYPDGALESAPREAVLRDLVRWLRRIRPHVVITWGPDGGYGHPDHVVTGGLALRAMELAGIAKHEPALGEHWHVRRCYRMVAPVEDIERFRRLAPEFDAYMDTLAVKPQRWTRADLGATIDIRAVADRKHEAMAAHRTQRPDLERLDRARDAIPFVATEESFIRAFPDPGGPPLETDLFAGLRARVLASPERSRARGQGPRR